MIKSIQGLCDKIKNREEKKLKDGREYNNAYVLLTDALENINNHSSCVFSNYLMNQKEFCSGFLLGLLSVNYITDEELRTLYNELTSAYESYLQRCAQEAAERNGDSPEDFDLMSLEGGVAL